LGEDKEGKREWKMVPGEWVRVFNLGDACVRGNIIYVGLMYPGKKNQLAIKNITAYGV
jgi:hypothetical protein